MCGNDGCGSSSNLLKLGGPAVQVTEETGIKVAAENPEQTVHDLAKAMIRLAEPQLDSHGTSGTKASAGSI
jgi:hypothetical protein